MLSWLLSLFLWLKSLVLARAERIVLKTLAAGPVPRHVAFVMDGNRRYARKKHMTVTSGHSEGFLALKRLLEICLHLNVRCVTVYAFSIENFKRPPEEVDALMTLAKEKLYEMCQNGDLFDKYGIKLNVLGRKHMLPPDVQEAVHKAESMTARNTRAILNLCMPYTAQDDIVFAIERTARQAVAGEIDVESIDEHVLDANLMTSLVGSPPLDILVRTSGVHRLSDFMLWQCCEDTQIQFVSTYWPDFGMTDFIPIILAYQRKVWDRRRQELTSLVVKSE